LYTPVLSVLSTKKSLVNENYKISKEGRLAILHQRPCYSLCR
jgi:hypothetical protein